MRMIIFLKMNNHKIINLKANKMKATINMLKKIARIKLIIIIKIINKIQIINMKKNYHHYKCLKEQVFLKIHLYQLYLSQIEIDLQYNKNKKKRKNN